MTYKNKVIILSALAGTLAIVYALTFLLDPQRKSARNAAYTWLSARQIPEASAIAVRTGADEGKAEVLLEKTADGWAVKNEDKSYPAKKEWVEELLAALAKKGSYPVRSKTESAHAKLGVDEKAAKQITVKGKNGQVLLDLYIGNLDTTGKRYMRKNGSAETRSGEDNLRGWGSYVTGYYDLRLFPDHDKNNLSVADVQRIIINPLPPSAEEDGGEKSPAAANASAPWTLVRDGNEWKVEGKNEVKLDTVQVESYVRSVLDASGDDYLGALNVNDDPFIAKGNVPGRLTIQTGEGSERRVTISEKSGGKTPAVVSGGEHVFALSDWTVNQVFKNYETMKAAE